MKLDLRFTPRPLRVLYCEAVAALVFSGFDPDVGMAATLDRKTTEILQGLCARGFWAASGGETLLLASEARLKAQKILLRGLGDRRACRSEDLIQGVREMGRALKGMGVYDFSVWIPPLPGADRTRFDILRASCLELVGVFSHVPNPDLFLKIVYSVDEALTLEEKVSLEGVGKELPPSWSCTVVVE